MFTGGLPLCLLCGGILYCTNFGQLLLLLLLLLIWGFVMIADCAGASVVVRGSGLGGAQVQLGMTRCHVTSASNTELTFIGALPLYSDNQLV